MRWARVLALLAVAALAGCVTTPAVDTPDGFAAYRATTAAVSPEGVGFRLREVPNDPRQSSAFWSAVLERHMTEAGYALVRREGFTATAGPGIAFEWAAPVGEEDWIYLVALVVAGESILVAEAAGPVEKYRRHREAVIDALTTISTGR